MTGVVYIQVVARFSHMIPYFRSVGRNVKEFPLAHSRLLVVTRGPVTRDPGNQPETRLLFMDHS